MPKEDPFVNRAQLLKAIKKYPEIWDSNNKLHMCRSVTSPMWSEIAEQFGGHVPTVKLQSIWSQMKYHYHNLVHRQILHKDRFTTKWEHFEPMSFMYSITVAKIVGAAANGETNAEQLSATQQQQPQEQQQQLNEGQTQSSLPTSHGRGRPSGSFTWLPHVTGPPPSATTTPPSPPPPAPLPPTSSAGIATTSMPAEHQHHQHHQHVQHHTQLDVGTPSQQPQQQHIYTAFTGLVPPAAITVEATTTPMRKLGRPSSLHNSMRGRIIDAIKARPPLWAGRQREQRQGQNRTSAVWKECAAELGLTPTLVQTRWSIIKQRYVDELQKERHAQYAQQDFRSNWEHFERMTFMREILIKKVDEREQTREQIQEIVSEHHHQQQQQQQQQQQHHHHEQQLHHQQQQQHHLQVAQHLQQQQHYPPPPPLQHRIGLAEHAQDMPIGLVHQPAQQSPLHVVNARRQRHHAAHHHHPHHLKHEADLEWDPFEMIMHVHGGQVGGNTETPPN